MSEIDSIFGTTSSSSTITGKQVIGAKGIKARSGAAPVAQVGKGKRKADAQLSSGSPSTAASSSSSSSSLSSSSCPQSTSKKIRSVPATIFDPSAEIERIGRVAAKQAKGNAKGKATTKSVGKSSTGEDKDLGSFIDSRGSHRNRTEEGFAIYSEKELNLGKGGDTPLCPFDCDCCF